LALLDLNVENHATLLAYLRMRGTIGPGEAASFHNLAGGVSNRVVLVQPEHGTPFVIKQALQKLRVETDWFCPPERIHSEAMALKYFAELAPPGSIPALLFEDHERHLLAMEAVSQPHANWTRLLLRGVLDSQHVEQFGRLLGSLHRESERRKLEFEKLFENRFFFEALRLEPYYRYTAVNVPESATFLSDLITDTLACRLTLVHGDYSPKNILIQAGRLVLLDYEVAHFGDPGFDLGFSMTHFLSKANHMREYRVLFAQAALQYWQVYTGHLGNHLCRPELEARAVRHTLACCLARVAGRSPLEYLTAGERANQRAAVLSLMKHPPGHFDQMVNEFITRLSCS
jgi:5-methylthioribose kinase